MSLQDTWLLGMVQTSADRMDGQMIYGSVISWLEQVSAKADPQVLIHERFKTLQSRWSKDGRVISLGRDLKAASAAENRLMSKHTFLNASVVQWCKSKLFPHWSSLRSICWKADHSCMGALSNAVSGARNGSFCHRAMRDTAACSKNLGVGSINCRGAASISAPLHPCK